MTAGLTTEGFVPKGVDEIIAGIEQRQRAKIEHEIDTSPDSVIGQINGSMGDKLAELWELAHELYDSLDPDAVTGARQDVLYSLTGTLRKGARKSRVVATVNLDPGVNIPAGEAVATVDGNPSARFVNAEPMVNEGGVAADLDVVFESEATGPVVANADTLTEIATFLSGWNSITNDDNATLGTNIESNAAFRARRVTELAAGGGGTVDGIRADLTQLPGVTAARVIENDTFAIVDTLPPKSLEAIVQGGADAVIAASLFSNKIGGIEMVGAVPVVVTDEYGGAHTVRFSRPTDVPVYLAIEVETGPGYAGAAAVKDAIVTASLDPLSIGYATIGGTVYSGRSVTVAMQVLGVLNARAGVSLSSISDPDAGAPSVALTARQLAAFEASQIEVVEL